MSSPPSGSQPAVVAAMVRGAVIPAAVVLVATAGVWVLVGGWLLGVASALGGVLAVGAFWTGLVGIRAVLRGAPQASLVGALSLYGVQVCVLVAVVLLLREQAWLDGLAFSVGLLTAGLAYQAGQVLAFLRARTLLVDSPPPAEPQ